MTTEMSYFHPIYFPTKVAIVDDDADYLEQVSLLVDDDVACDLFTSPSQALKAMQRYQKKNGHLAQQCSCLWNTSLESVDDPRDYVSNSHQLVDNDQRFDHFSVVVIDYAMPEMSGLDLCAQLQDPWIKKILITGKADSDIAVEAFNQGLIDHFIRKEADDIDIHLNSAINKLSHQYFTEICTTNNTKLTQEAPYLFDENFLDWFSLLCEKHDIVEYYLMRNVLINEFLLVNRDGELKFLFLQTSEQAKAQYEIASDHKEIPKDLLDAIRARGVVSYFSGRYLYDVSYKESWQNYVYVAQQIGDYNYALVSAQDLPECKTEHVGYSYNQFLKSFYSGMQVN